MPLSRDYSKIKKNFIKQYGHEKGTETFYKWCNKNGIDWHKPYGGKNKPEEDAQWIPIHVDDGAGGQYDIAIEINQDGAVLVDGLDSEQWQGERAKLRQALLERVNRLAAGDESFTDNDINEMVEALSSTAWEYDIESPKVDSLIDEIFSQDALISDLSNQIRYIDKVVDVIDNYEIYMPDNGQEDDELMEEMGKCEECGTMFEDCQDGDMHRIKHDIEKLKSKDIPDEKSMSSLPKDPNVPTEIKPQEAPKVGNVEGEVFDVIDKISAETETLEIYLRKGKYDKAILLYKRITRDLMELDKYIRSLQDKTTPQPSDAKGPELPAPPVDEKTLGAKLQAAKSGGNANPIPVPTSAVPIYNPEYPQGSPVTNYPIGQKDYIPAPTSYIKFDQFKEDGLDVELNWFNETLDQLSTIKDKVNDWMEEARYKNKDHAKMYEDMISRKTTWMDKGDT